MSTSTTIGTYTFTPTYHSVYMALVCPRCLIPNLLKFTGTFRDTKGTKFGIEEKWQFMLVLCRECSVVPRASNIRSMNEVKQLMKQNWDVFEHISRTATKYTSVPESEETLMPENPGPILEAMRPHCVLCLLIGPTGTVPIEGAFMPI
jgi:hypothetical protein